MLSILSFPALLQVSDIIILFSPKSFNVSYINVSKLGVTTKLLTFLDKSILASFIALSGILLSLIRFFIYLFLVSLCGNAFSSQYEYCSSTFLLLLYWFSLHILLHSAVICADVFTDSELIPAPAIKKYGYCFIDLL